MPKRILNFLSRFLHERTNNALERQQLIVYLIGTAALIVGMPLHLIGVVGSEMHTLKWLTIVYMFLGILIFVLYIYKKVNLMTAFATYGILAQIILSAKIIILALLPAEQHYLVVMNSLISVLLTTLLVISYVHIVPIVMGAMDLVSIIAAGIIMQETSQWQFIVIFALYIVFLCLMSEMMYHNVMRLEKENTNYHSDERALLSVLRMNRREITVYVKMCLANNEIGGGNDDADRFFSMLNESSQRNIINAVEKKKSRDLCRETDLKKTFPEFTKTEIEVARLILEGKKLKQICNLLDKNESNINSVRAHIRKKLNLNHDDDLAEAIRQRAKE